MAMLKSRSGWTSLLTVLTIAAAWLVGFLIRLFSVIRFESIIHEYDPWFNYRSSYYMVEKGFDNFLNWFDDISWYPLGRIVGGTVYPGLMLTSGFIHYILNSLHIPIHIREVCVFLAPTFSGLTAWATYLLTKELWSTGAGLFAACFIAIVPGYLSRSVAGSYDNEGIAIFALMFTYYLWIKAVKTGTIMWAALCALSYLYMVSAWGGYVFIINLIPLHVFVLLIMQRYSSRIYVAYTTFFILGLLFSMQIPFVGFQPVRTSEHMASAGVFALIQVYAFLRYLLGRFTLKQLKYLFFGGIIVAAGIIFAAVVGLTYAGYVAPWSGRFYSLWDSEYAKIHIPIIASVSEHQPTTWTHFFFDLHILACAYPAGIWFCFRKLTDERVFIILYGISASYFAAVMIRLMLTLTPVVCVLSAIAFSHVLSIYVLDAPKTTASTAPGSQSTSEISSSDIHQEVAQLPAASSSGRSLYDKPATPVSGGSLKTSGGKPKSQRGAGIVSGIGLNPVSSEEAVTMSVKSMVTLVIMILFFLFVLHCTYVSSYAYSSPSIVLATYQPDGSRYILDDFREAYYWLRKNTEPKARVMSWWDYGYQITGMANRSTLVDNNTWNNSHIALVGKAMASNETEAYKIMRALDVDYVLVVFGGLIGYSSDDINKFLWMVRIAEGEHPNEIREIDYFSPQGEYRVDGGASKIMLNCMLYKMCYYRFGEVQVDPRNPSGFDRSRHVEIGRKHFTLEHIEEAFTSENWIVRIYKVKHPSNRIPRRANSLRRRPRQFMSRKTISNKKGTLKFSSVVIKGRKPGRR